MFDQEVDEIKDTKWRQSKKEGERGKIELVSILWYFVSNVSFDGTHLEFNQEEDRNFLFALLNNFPSSNLNVKYFGYN